MDDPWGHPGFFSVIYKDVVSMGIEKAGSPPCQGGGWGEGGRAEPASVGSLLLTQPCTYYLQSQLIDQNLVT